MIIESKMTLGLIFAMATQAIAALVWAGGAGKTFFVLCLSNHNLPVSSHKKESRHPSNLGGGRPCFIFHSPNP